MQAEAPFLPELVTGQEFHHEVFLVCNQLRHPATFCLCLELRRRAPRPGAYGTACRTVAHRVAWVGGVEAQLRRGRGPPTNGVNSGVCSRGSVANGVKRWPAEDEGQDVVVVGVVVVYEDVRASVGVHGCSTAGHVGRQGVDGDDGWSDDEVPDNATSRFDEVVGDDGRGDEAR